jgi:hypothetical protein
MRYYWIFFALLVLLLNFYLYSEDIELEKKEDMGFLHFSAGAFKGIESNDLIN